MKFKNKTWFKLLCVPLSILQFMSKNMHPISLMQALTLSLYNTMVPLVIRSWLLRLASNLVRVLIAGFEMLLELNFRLCNLSPCTISLDDKTVMQFWVPTKRKLDKPDLALIHGFGGTSRWQFCWQIWHLSRRLNLFVPDLLFFGESYSGHADRSDVFQAKCVGEGMKKLGVRRFSVAGISYGGYVAYRMGEMYPNVVDKVAIVSCGICYTEEQKIEHLKKIGRNPSELLVPEKPQDLRCLLNLCLFKFDILKRVPDFILEEAIKMLHEEHRKEKSEILEYLLTKADSNLGILSQETLIIWGDKDCVFPIRHAYQLQRHLEPKAKLAVIKDTGHAVNYDSPIAMNNLIISFVKN